jgi:hypothetical protein
MWIVRLGPIQLSCRLCYLFLIVPVMETAADQSIKEFWAGGTTP